MFWGLNSLVANGLKLLKNNYVPNPRDPMKGPFNDHSSVGSPFAQTYSIVAHSKWESLTVMDRAKLADSGWTPEIYEATMGWFNGADLEQNVHLFASPQIKKREEILRILLTLPDE